jgi:hypothetical protein
MNDDDKKAYREYGARQEAISERKRREAIAALKARYDSACQQLERIVDEFADILEGEGLGLEELARLTQCLKERKGFIFGNMVDCIGSAYDFAKKPTVKNMILTQIERLENSSDKADQGLVKFLKQTFDGKGYTATDWRTETTMDLAIKALDHAQEKGISHSQAARDIAKKANVSKKRIENLIPAVVKDREEMVRDFLEAENSRQE